jgi:hypothetical protein
VIWRIGEVTLGSGFAAPIVQDIIQDISQNATHLSALDNQFSAIPIPTRQTTPEPVKVLLHSILELRPVLHCPDQQLTCCGSALSQLELLEQNLAKAQAYFQLQLIEAEAQVKGWEHRQAATLAVQQSQLHQTLLIAHLGLKKLRNQLGQLGEILVSESLKQALTADEWTNQLSVRFDANRNLYQQAINQSVQAAIAPTQMHLPSFRPSATAVEISAATDPAAMIKATVSNWLGFGSGNLKQGSLKQQDWERVTQAARTQVASLQTETEQYLEFVAEQLVVLEQTNQPQMQPAPVLIAAQQTAQYYRDLVDWCRSFQVEIASIKPRSGNDANQPAK